MHLEDDKMHWQFGGNFEPVRMVCELDWKECPYALANYIWTEIVTDVIECLTSDGLIWRVLAMLVVCTLLVRTLYSRAKWCEDTTVNRRSLNRVGYRVQDLELKVNILTYKMQYGTWPLPHQIHGSAFRKQLRNLKLTLSNPDDYNTWIKHLLLSPLRKNPCLSYPKLEPYSTRHLTEFFNAERKAESKQVPAEVSAIDCSVSKSSKTSTENNCMARSSAKCSRQNSRSSENMDPRQRRVSTSENSILRRRTDKSVSRRENEEQPGRPQSQRRTRRQARGRNPPCEGIGRTMDECKRYLKQLKSSNRNFGQASSASEVSEGSSIRAEWNSPQALLRSSREITDMVNEAEKRWGKNTMKVERLGKKKKGKLSEEAPGEFRENDLKVFNGMASVKKVGSKKLLPPTLNITFHAKMFPRDPSIEELASILVSGTPRQDRPTKTSRETLQQVKKRLESLQNVLKVYETRDSKVKAVEKVDRNEEKLRSICQSVATTLNSIKEEIDRMYERKNSRVTFNFDEQSSELEKLGQDRSTVSLQSSKVFEICRQTVSANLQQDQQTLLEDSPIPSSRNYDTGTKYLQMCFNSEHDDLDSDFAETYDKQSQTCYENYVSRVSTGVGFERTKDDLLESAVQTDKVGSNFPELRKVVYKEITDSESYESGNPAGKLKPQTEDAGEKYLAGSPRNFKRSKDGRFSENSENYPVPMETDDDTMILSRVSSQSEVSRDSESVDKSTGLLLQQALEFKKALLSQVQREKCQSTRENQGQNASDGETDEASKMIVGDYGQGKLLEIINEENASTERSARTGDGTDVDQWNEQFSSTEKEKEDQTLQIFENEDLRPVPSEYFSLSNLALPENLPRVKNINELVLQSARKIKDFTEMFSQTQNRAILETRTAIKNQNQNSQDIQSEGNLEEEIEEIDEGSSGNPNLTLKRHRGMFSIAEEISSKTMPEESAKTDEIMKDSCSDGEARRLKSTEENSNDISVIHESLIITESDHDRLNDFDNANTVVLPANSNMSIVKENNNEIVEGIPENQNQMEHEKESEKQENFSEANEVTDAERREEIQLDESRNLLSNEETEENDRLNHEKLLMNFLSTFSSHCSSLCITDESPNIFNHDSTNCLRDTSGRGEEEVVEIQERQLEDEHASKGTIILSKNSQQIVDAPVNIEGEENVKLSQDFTSPVVEECKKKDSSLDDTVMKPIEVTHTSELPINNKQTKDTNYRDEEKSKGEMSYLSSNMNLSSNTSGSYADASSREFISSSILNLSGNKLRTSIAETSMMKRTAESSSVSLPQRRNAVPWSPKSHLHSNDCVKSRRQEVNSCQLKARSNSSLSNAMNLNFIVGRRRDLSAESHNRTRNEDLVQRRSRSYVTPRKTESSPRYSMLKTNHVSPRKSESSPRQMGTGIQDVRGYSAESKGNNAEGRARGRTSSKSQIPVLKATSRSSIPLLKSRLDSARRTDRENRSKSPLKSPLPTMCHDDSPQGKENPKETIIPTAGHRVLNEKSTDTKKANEQHVEKKKEREVPKAAEVLEDQMNLRSRDRMVIYINILTKHDSNVTRIVDPKKFMAYARDREIQVENSSSNDRTVVSLAMRENERSGTSRTSNFLGPENLSRVIVKSSWTGTVEKRETDVTAKPSVTETSTSISDLQPGTELLKGAEKFQVFGVPKELTNEEYVVLLETLNQDSNVVHLHEIAKLCNRLEANSLKTE